MSFDIEPEHLTRPPTKEDWYEAAVVRERERVEAAKKAEEAETAKREADKNHQRKINGEAVKAIMFLNVTEELAKLIVSAIAKGEIPHVKIIY